MYTETRSFCTTTLEQFKAYDSLQTSRWDEYDVH